MLDLVRTSLHRVLTTPAGDRLLPVRLPKDLARRVNVVLGEPICSREELDRRRAGRARLDELRRGGASAAREPAHQAPAQAPVVVYYEQDRHVHALRRIEETLTARKIAYTLLDVSDDEVTKDFVMREARVKEDELPVVFVATAAVGGYNELVEWDVSGKLEAALHPGRSS